MRTLPKIAGFPRTILAILLLFVSATGFSSISCVYSGQAVLSQWSSQQSEPMVPDSMPCCAGMSTSVFERICDDVPECNLQHEESEANSQQHPNVFLAERDSCVACSTDTSAISEVKISSDTVSNALYSITPFNTLIVYNVSPRIVANASPPGTYSLPIYVRFSAYRI